MTQDEQKNLWKEESAQLRADLASRQKVIKKQEVPIQFGGVASPEKAPSSASIDPTLGGFSDEILRRNLGL